MKALFRTILLVVFVLFIATAVFAQSTRVPGHRQARYDLDGNGYADVGVVVTNHYTALYAFDASGNWYWDLGDGRIYGTVASINDLDQATLTRDDYVIDSRGMFNNDEFLDNGWVINSIKQSGYAGSAHFVYLIVHSSDPRYTGNPDWAIWGDWEYQVLTISGEGNITKNLLLGPNH